MFANRQLIVSAGSLAIVFVTRNSGGAAIADVG
jgi:hypothetical protein